MFIHDTIYVYSQSLSYLRAFSGSVLNFMYIVNWVKNYMIVIMTIISIVMGQQRFIGNRAKSKFRPRPEWFGEMMPRPEAVIYEEQNNPPVIAVNSDNSPFHDFYLDEYEIPESSFIDETGRYPRRHKEPEVFQNICPTVTKLVDTKTDKRFNHNYEYHPSTFIEVFCTNPYNGRLNLSFGRFGGVCHDRLTGKCIQKNETMYFYRELKVSSGVNENCGEPEPRVVYTSCECMWDKNLLGDILDVHLKLENE